MSFFASGDDEATANAQALATIAIGRALVQIAQALEVRK